VNSGGLLFLLAGSENAHDDRPNRNQSARYDGKPVIKGTRIKVELIRRKLAEGASEDDLLDAYPRLSREDIRAAIEYAADTIAHEEITLLPASESNAKS